MGDPLDGSCQVDTYGSVVGAQVLSTHRLTDQAAVRKDSSTLPSGAPDFEVDYGSELRSSAQPAFHGLFQLAPDATPLDPLESTAQDRSPPRPAHDRVRPEPPLDPRHQAPGRELDPETARPRHPAHRP